MTRLLYPLIEVVDRSGQAADEIHARQSFRKSHLSITISVPSRVNKVREEVVFKWNGSIFVGVKEVKDLVEDFDKEAIGDAVQDVPLLRLVKDRAILILIKNIKSHSEPTLEFGKPLVEVNDGISIGVGRMP